MKLNYVGRAPERRHCDDAGYDCCARLFGPVTIAPGEIRMVKLGFALEVPSGYAALVMPRSGLGSRGITLANCVGLIDPGYRGEVGAALINLGSEPYTVSNGDRIAQLVLVKVEDMEFNKVDRLSETERGTGGFGSSGTK